MQIDIGSTADLGLVIRAARRNGRVRIDDLAATAGVSKQFVSDVERGKPTVQVGLVLKLLEELGVVLRLDITRDAAAQLAALRAQGGLKPARRRLASARDERA
jgi:transcriptional regulator with XRE-family HTH domain